MTVGLIRPGALVRGGLPFRHRVTGKKGNHTFYKGKGGNKGGRHTKFGYQILPEKLKFLEVPDLSDCKLTPYVSHETPKPRKTTITSLE